MRKRLIIFIIFLILLSALVWLGRLRHAASQVLPEIPAEKPPASLPPASLRPSSVLPKRLTVPASAPSPRPPMVPVTAVPVVTPLPILQTRPQLPPPMTAEPLAPREWKGNNDTSITRAGQISVQTDEQWIHFWAEHHPDEAAPEVDFSRDMVVGVFLGLRPSDGFQVTIINVHPLSDKLVVDYIQLDPPPGTFQMGVTAYPYDIKVIPRSTLRVTFNRLTPQYQKNAVSQK